MVDWPSPQTISLLQSSIILSLINQLHSSSLFNKRNKGEVDAAEINGVDWSGIPPLQEERQLITHNKREERQPFIYSIPSTHQLIFSFFIEFKEKMNWSWVAFSFWKKKRKAGCPLLKKREEGNPTPSTIPWNEGLHAHSFISLELLRSLPRSGAAWRAVQSNLINPLNVISLISLHFINLFHSIQVD